MPKSITLIIKKRNRKINEHWSDEQAKHRKFRKISKKTEVKMHKKDNKKLCILYEI